VLYDDKALQYIESISSNKHSGKELLIDFDIYDSLFAEYVKEHGFDSGELVSLQQLALIGGYKNKDKNGEFLTKILTCCPCDNDVDTSRDFIFKCIEYAIKTGDFGFINYLNEKNLFFRKDIDKKISQSVAFYLLRKCRTSQNDFYDNCKNLLKNFTSLELENLFCLSRKGVKLLGMLVDIYQIRYKNSGIKGENWLKYFIRANKLNCNENVFED